MKFAFNILPGEQEQPDAPNASCCDEADAYWADEIHVMDGKTCVTHGIALPSRNRYVFCHVESGGA